MLSHCILMCGMSLNDSDWILLIAISAPYTFCTGSSQLVEFEWVIFTGVDCVQHVNWFNKTHFAMQVLRNARAHYIKNQLDWWLTSDTGIMLQ